MVFAPQYLGLSDKGKTMREGTVLDGTIIMAPPSPENRSESRDFNMRKICYCG
jgi:hypothetical protein